MSRRPAAILLVDASPYIFRAHFALPGSLVDRQGRSSNAVYGFGSFLLKLIDEERPTHLAVAFDGSLTTSFRNEIYPQYKQHREPPPPDLEAQLEDCRTLTRALGAATFIDDRFEADDLLASLCLSLGDRAATIVTSDKDLSQLVDERISWLDYGRQRRYGPAQVRERFGVEPRRIPDLLGLAGDPVDNIPGVRGVGTKTAVALLAYFGSLEEVCARSAEIPSLGLRGGGRIRRLIEEQREMALMSKRLATVARDAVIDTSLDDLRLAAPRHAVLDPLFERLGFDKLYQRIVGRR
ncbi:MAG: hypothetical protein O7A04_11840 [Acidobacteria bacterium]|nr:hypothetical protein [Acidobacteriota bacterium]